MLVTPGLSNLTKLSAIHLLGPISGYKAIGTFLAPDFQQLDLYFSGPIDDPDLQDPILPLFNTGGLTSLTKLEIGSFAHFEQVDALPWQLTIQIGSAKEIWCSEQYHHPLPSSIFNREKNAARLHNLKIAELINFRLMTMVLKFCAVCF